MTYLITVLLCTIFGGVIVYAFINPNEKIENNELREFETLDAGYGDKINNLLLSDNEGINEQVVERYFYLKHKYNLTKNKTTKK